LIAVSGDFVDLSQDRLHDGDDDDSDSLCSWDLLSLLFISATIILIAFCGKKRRCIRGNH